MSATHGASAATILSSCSSLGRAAGACAAAAARARDANCSAEVNPRSVAGDCVITPVDMRLYAWSARTDSGVGENAPPAATAAAAAAGGGGAGAVACAA